MLPFANGSGDSANQIYAYEITEEVTTGLTRVAGLRVAPGTVAAALASQGLAVRTIVDSLGVATVMNGTVRRSGDRLMVAARLVRAQDGRVLWSETYDREVLDIFAI